MNKNKIILLVITWVIVLLLWLLLSSLKNWASAPVNTYSNIKEYTIWIVWDEKQKFDEFLSTFKAKNPKYANTNIVVESFPDYNDYYYTLVWAFLSWKAPDLFVLNNGEKKSVFEEQIMWLDPALVDPDKMSSDFEPVFANDLIMQAEIEGEDWVIKKVDFVKWVPLGYESLWIFYSFRNFKGMDLSTWAWVNDSISKLKESNEDIITVWLGNWSTVVWASDIITQFFIQNWLKALDEVTDKKMLQSFYSYMMYWTESLWNNYNKRFNDLLESNKNNLDLFSRWEVALVLGYPSLLNEIDKNWFNKSFLRASPIPQNSKNWWESLVNYNYFVMNKNSINMDLSKDLMTYFFSEEGEKEYLKNFPYYLPAHLSLLQDRLDEKLDNKYNLEYWNFYNREALLVSFDKKNKVLYDEKMISILDSFDNYKFLFEKFQKSLLCSYNKMINFEWLSIKCE